MLEKVLVHIHNWFERDKASGTWVIEDGSIDIHGIQEGQYFRIIGSVFNDGLHQYPASELTDETFKGSIWGLAIPKDLLSLVDEISEWQEKYEGADSPFASESFGGYSYSKGSEPSSADDPLNGWQRHFASRLNPYRKLG